MREHSESYSQSLQVLRLVSTHFDDFRLQLCPQPGALLPCVSVHKGPRQQIQQQVQQQLQQQLQQRAISQAEWESEAVCPFTTLFSSSPIQCQHQLWKVKQQQSSVLYYMEEGAREHKCKLISVKKIRPKKYHYPIYIIKSNPCDAIMYEHKMHVEYKISRLFERLILKSFHFKECHHVRQGKGMPDATHRTTCRPTWQKYKRFKDINGLLLMTQGEVKGCFATPGV